MRTLVVYYSLSGTARTIATAVAKELGADIQEIRCERYSPEGGAWGFVRAAFDSLMGNLPSIEPLVHTPRRYELVVIGGPVWTSHPATPVRAFLRKEKSWLSATAFFVTLGGAGAERALREMEQLAGVRPKATLSVREQDVKEGKFDAAVRSFAAGLRRSEAA